jgi:hypothetical protein
MKPVGGVARCSALSAMLLRNLLTLSDLDI